MGMIKEFLKDRLLFQARSTNLRHESESEFERQWQAKMRKKAKKSKKKNEFKKTQLSVDEDALKSDFDDMKNIIY